MVLDTLERLEVPATFFLVGRGRRAARGAGPGPAGPARGGQPHLGAPGPGPDRRRTRRTTTCGAAHDAIAAATGKAPRLLRPPWGHLGGAVLHAAARMRYRLVLWSAQMLECAFPDDPVGHARYVVEQVTPGTILLAHDIGRPERLVGLLGLPQIIGELRDRGYEFRTVSDLLSEAQA